MTLVGVALHHVQQAGQLWALSAVRRRCARALWFSKIVSMSPDPPRVDAIGASRNPTLARWSPTKDSNLTNVLRAFNASR